MTTLIHDLAAFVPDDRLIRDPLRLLAYGTDASFYRLVPKVVVKAESEDEVRSVLDVCHRHHAPVTFRAAGTSLSGQSVTDSVLLLLGDNWNGVRVLDQGLSIALQPGVIGAEANRRLAAFARKIGPDPASIDSAKIGGMAANNSSGMCCGTADNSYQTLVTMRLILADGTLVDTGDAASVERFRHSHAGLLAELAELGRATRADQALAERIRAKFAIKNTTGYGLNSLVDFEDPLDILQHLMIGSEGTLGFIAEITYRTVPDHADKASTLMLFPDLAEACRAVAILKSHPVAAVELMDRPALRAVEDKPGMPDGLADLPDQAAALLVETRAENAAALAANIEAISQALAGFGFARPHAFTTDSGESAKLWKIRKGLFPAVGAVRKVGTTVIIEDVAFKIPDLAAATLDLQALLTRHAYPEAIIFGHALDGNLHFVFTQDFGQEAEVKRYAALMDDVADLVVNKYDGSLKAEHGTGRNMAPFVALEWGTQAHALMWRIKRLLDPQGLLNPGVIMDDNPHAHLENLKPLPPADPLVDTCIECGFCERMCPSHGLTLSPRQRITGWREISRADAAGEDSRALSTLYDYMGLDTCAACGLCATACPVGIETGSLIKALRGRKAGGLEKGIGRLAGKYFGATLTATRLGLAAASLVRRHWPRPAQSPRPGKPASTGDAVVYIPSCASRAMGTAASDGETRPLTSVVATIFDRAGFAMVLPDGLDELCCGLPFESRGLAATAQSKGDQMLAALITASDGGRLPVVMDTSACSNRLKAIRQAGLTVLDLVEFLATRALPRLTIRRQTGPVLLHVPCSIKKQGLEEAMIALARACADQVVVPESVTCCGFGGDRGFAVPELNSHALRRLTVPETCPEGFSANRTCEIGLTEHAGIPYRSIAYLVERLSRMA
ncbi:Oxidoreductase, FAD/iron-sulfur cluster-binding domain protein [Magnetospirillum sp. LM-5]|uniref:FAD-binding and (Fe-S)-binding domain-containing protein n=1 Tax=Magnetospirillum sp. LM-5 TaxID=2681466 RepID=UPI001385606D|nr:FAD-binding and (Fe-S)-binding domain-containing protein [Magnetospirillum sp. LM-5]CAA7619163.1 Oxidoreductase, FAD/iron-sulfur cluster-binding domain protein [Magnetospirillum sp. LM-5]